MSPPILVTNHKVLVFYYSTFPFISYSETISGVNNGVCANMGHISPEEDMSIASSTDDSVAAAAVFRHLGNNYKTLI